MSSFPLVSVIMPTYKRSDFLLRAIDSLLNQTYERIEIIVVDDNDPETSYRKETEERMESVKDSRVRYIQHSSNQNGSVARNTGLAAAKGELVTFLDDDDTYKADKIEKQVAYLLDNPCYRAVYCGWTRGQEVTLPSHEGNLTYDILSGDNIIYTNAIMMWTKEARAAGWDKNFQRNQEAAFLLRYFRQGHEIGVISQSLVDFDLSDRSNVAKNGRVNEEHMTQLLATFSDLLATLPRKEAALAVCHRYRGMLLYYLKSKDLLGAVSLALRASLKHPYLFPREVLAYVVKRVQS